MFNNSDSLKLLGLLVSEFNTYDPIIYFETFGNKKSTITAGVSFDNIKKSIFTAFDSTIINYAVVDICLSFSLGKNKVTLANDNFYKALQLEPNFRPLFSNTVLNYHANTQNFKTGESKTIGFIGNCYKINLYSTFKYRYKAVLNNESYKMPLAQVGIFSNFFGFLYCISKEKFDTIAELYDHTDQEREIDCNSTCPFRLELRCDFKNAEDIIKKILSYISGKENFDYYYAEEFFELVQNNLTKFVNIIRSKVNNPNIKLKDAIDSMLTIVISETIMKLRYLYGYSHISLLSENINEIISKELQMVDKGMSELQNILHVIDQSIEQLSLQEKTKLIINQMKYYVNIDNVFKKKQAIRVLDFLITHYYGTSQIDETEFLKNIFNVYVEYHTGNLESDYNLLKEPLNSIEPMKNVNVLIKQNFIDILYKPSSTSITILVKFFIDKYNLTINETQDKIQQFMFSNQLSTLFLYKTFLRNIRCKIYFSKIDAMYECPKTSIAHKKTLLIKKLTTLYTGNFDTSVKTSYDEIISLLHGVYSYRNNSKSLFEARTNLIYNLFFKRTHSWCKKRISCIKRFISSKTTLAAFISDIKNYKCENISPVDRFEELEHAGFVITNEFKDAYLKLLALNVKEHERHCEEIQAASASEILFCYNSMLCKFKKLKKNIIKWSGELMLDKSPENFFDTNTIYDNDVQANNTGIELFEFSNNDDECIKNSFDDDDDKANNFYQQSYNSFHTQLACRDGYNNNDLVLDTKNQNVDVVEYNFHNNDDKNLKKNKKVVLNTEINDNIETASRFSCLEIENMNIDFIRCKNNKNSNTILETNFNHNYNVNKNVVKNETNEVDDEIYSSCMEDYFINQNCNTLTENSNQTGYAEFCPATFFKNNDLTKNVTKINKLAKIAHLNPTSSTSIDNISISNENESEFDHRSIYTNNDHFFSDDIDFQYNTTPENELNDSSIDITVDQTILITENPKTQNRIDGFSQTTFPMSFIHTPDSFSQKSQSVESVNQIKKAKRMSTQKNKKVSTLAKSLVLKPDNYYFNKLFCKYKYGKFSSSKTRELLFKSSNRPTPEQWKQIMRRAVESNIMSSLHSNMFKFNLKLNDDSEILTFYDIIKICRCKQYEAKDKCFTLEQIKERVTSANFNDDKCIDEYISYMQTLVTEFYLQYDHENDKGIKFYYLKVL